MHLGDKRVWFGMGIGASVVAAAPLVLPVFGAIVRPLFKETVKQGLFGYERAREVAARVAEALSDLVAEIRAETEEALSQREEARRQAAAEKPVEGAPQPTEATA